MRTITWSLVFGYLHTPLMFCSFAFFTYSLYLGTLNYVPSYFRNFNTNFQIFKISKKIICEGKLLNVQEYSISEMKISKLVN
jgi:hypothetical protein